MQLDNWTGSRPLSLGDFINTPAGRELLDSADTAFARVDFGSAARFLEGRLASMAHLENGDDLALGELLEQIAALKSTAENLNGFAVAFYVQSGGFALVVEAIKHFCRQPSPMNRARLLEAAAPLAGYHRRMPPRVRHLLRPFIKGYFWRRELLSYGKLYLAMCDHMKVGANRS